MSGKVKVTYRMVDDTDEGYDDVRLENTDQGELGIYQGDDFILVPPVHREAFMRCLQRLQEDVNGNNDEG